MRKMKYRLNSPVAMSVPHMTNEIAKMIRGHHAASCGDMPEFTEEQWSVVKQLVVAASFFRESHATLTVVADSRKPVRKHLSEVSWDLVRYGTIVDKFSKNGKCSLLEMRELKRELEEVASVAAREAEVVAAE